MEKIYAILFIITFILAVLIVLFLKYKKRLLELESKVLLQEKEHIQKLLHTPKNISSDEERIKAKQEIIKLKILIDDDWIRFRDKFELLYPHFLNALTTSDFHFTKSEKRFLMLKKLNLETKEIANMVGVSSDSILKTQYRLRKKLAIDKSIDMILFLEQSTEN